MRPISNNDTAPTWKTGNRWIASCWMSAKELVIDNKQTLPSLALRWKTWTLSNSKMWPSHRNCHGHHSNEIQTASVPLQTTEISSSQQWSQELLHVQHQRSFFAWASPPGWEAAKSRLCLNIRSERETSKHKCVIHFYVCIYFCTKINAFWFELVNVFLPDGHPETAFPSLPCLGPALRVHKVEQS